MRICFIWLEFKGIVHKWIISAGCESDHDHDGGHVGSMGFLLNLIKIRKLAEILHILELF